MAENEQAYEKARIRGSVHSSENREISRSSGEYCWFDVRNGNLARICRAPSSHSQLCTANVKLSAANG